MFAKVRQGQARYPARITAQRELQRIGPILSQGSTSWTYILPEKFARVNGKDADRAPRVLD